MIDFSYVVAPLLAWFFAGTTKFIIASIKARCLMFDLIGYGGFPSNHSAIVSCMTTLVALKEGISAPAFGVALTLAGIVMMDAHALRRQVGFHAEAINSLKASQQKKSCKHKMLRERMGHTYAEIIGGIFVGCFVAVGIYFLMPYSNAVIRYLFY